MPDGRRHTIASATIATVAFGSLFVYSPAGAFWCATGALAGILLTPDHDLPGNITYHYTRKYAGVLVEFLWKSVWFIYSHLFRHRSFWSHYPVISTAIRLTYIGLLISPVWYFLKLPIPELTWGMCWWVTGLVLADSAHFILDQCDKMLSGRL